MSTALQKGQRNQSMECAKMVASFLVVLIHVGFPGALGRDVFAISLFAVPMFLAISGYFSYGAGPKVLGRRIVHILILNVITDVIHLAWNVVATELAGGSSVAYLIRAIPDPDELIYLITIQHNTFLDHLWYLLSAAICYGILWAYVRFYGEDEVNYHNLYLAAGGLWIAYFAIGTILPLDGKVLAPMIFGNAWFYALPMFTLGIFLHEYQDRLMKNFRLNGKKLLGIVALGMALCLAHKKYLGDGVPIGMYIEVPALMLFLITHPTVPVRGRFGRALIGRFGVLSTAIYLLHVTLRSAYDVLLLGPVTALLGGAAKSGGGRCWCTCSPWCARLSGSGSMICSKSAGAPKPPCN